MDTNVNNDDCESLNRNMHDIGKAIGLLGSLMITNAAMDNYNKSKLEKMQNLVNRAEEADKM